MKNKTKRKKLIIEWPTNSFTIQDIQSLHPDAKNITLRYRINKALENNVITCIGNNTPSMGRPTLVFCKTVRLDECLKESVENGVVINEEFEDYIVEVVKVSDVKHLINENTVKV
jgi:hypothetical protein